MFFGNILRDVYVPVTQHRFFVERICDIDFCARYIRPRPTGRQMLVDVRDSWPVLEVGAIDACVSMQLTAHVCSARIYMARRIGNNLDGICRFDVSQAYPEV